MKMLRVIVLLLLVISALNYGLIGFFQNDLLGNMLGGMSSGLARFVFGVIGLAGLYGLTFFCRCCKKCKCNGSCSCCSSDKHCSK